MRIVNSMTQLEYKESMSEAELQLYIKETAILFEWWYFHDEDSRRNEPGLPDTILIKPPYMVWNENKTMKGRLRNDQKICLNKLSASHQIVYLWRPCDKAQILAVLSGVEIPVGNYEPVPVTFCSVKPTNDKTQKKRKRKTR